MGEIERQSPASPKRKRGPRPTHKWIKRIALCLILGVLINIAVASACAAFVPMTFSGGVVVEEMHHHQRRTPILVGQAFGVREWLVWNWSDTFTPGKPFEPYASYIEIGWPLASFVMTDDKMLEDYTWSKPLTMSAYIDPFLTDPLMSRLSRSPGNQTLRPLWRGVAANTLIYAFLVAIFMNLRIFTMALPRYRRARKGLCTSCGYDIAGLATCPECGSAPSPLEGEGGTSAASDG
ncbi:MAG: hypothetical protein KDA16_10965 [Phycisphaerales bacterium]|nr:hypothetical protein [Phycisphaerales bacterium]